MPFVFSPEATDALPPMDRCIEDRRNNPVRNRKTKFRLSQQNILAYTYPFVPGFAESGINSLPFRDLVEQAVTNAEDEGRHYFRRDFEVSANAKAKVAGDIFEELEAAIHWNAAARWNTYMATGKWSGTPRYPHPTTEPSKLRQIVVLSLPRRFDWARLLSPDALGIIQNLRKTLDERGLSLPTSTPDILITRLPVQYQADDRFQKPLPNLSKISQSALDNIYKDFIGKVQAGEFILALALKKSLRSDRLYQPLYEANIMQLLLEGRLQAPQVDFEVHTLASAGTRARETYRAASLSLVATDHASPHRAIRELYEPLNALEVSRRFLAFVDDRMRRIND